MKRLAIIDGKSVFYRGYYAMPGLSAADGTPTGGVYGFAAMSLELIKKLQPDFVVVAWDKPKTNIRKRREIYPEYKAGRKPAPADFYAQIPLLQELLRALHWPLYELDDYEADDIIGSLARQAEEQNIETCLISSDLDMLQCVNETTHMYALKRGFSNIHLFDPKSFEEKYGIRIDQFLDLKALKGDSSDNIPGVPGVGEKTAVALLQQYGTLDGVYEHIDEVKSGLQKKLIDGKDSAYMSKKVAEIWHDAPVELDLEEAVVTNLDGEALGSLLSRLEFTSLLKSMPKILHTSGGGAAPEVAPLVKSVVNNTTLTRLLMEPQVLMAVDNDRLVVASRDEWHEIESETCATLLEHVPIISFDANQLCMQLLADGVALPKTMYSVRQMEFLLSPLRRSHQEQDITGYEGDDTGTRLAHIWRIYDRQQEELQTQPTLLTVATTLDFPLIGILAKMQFAGIRLDTAKLDAMNQKVKIELHAVEQAIYTMVGYEFNMASPMQLSEVLFTKLQLPTTGIKRGRMGFSTSQKELDKLRGQHPIIEYIEKFRELDKIRNTYLESLPKLVDANSKLHTTFDQSIAATGRLSSNNPNLQNIPVRSEVGRHIREAFVPAEGCVFISADYSQFELRLAAVLAGDQQMIDDFNTDIDIHAKTASEVYKIPLEQVTKDQRRHAKVINFGVLYGMSPHGLSAATGMSFQEAKTFIDEYFALRQPVRKYIDDTIKKAHVEGFVETLYGRRRPTPDVKSSNFMVRTSAERAAANMPIQGTEADLMKKAMIRIENELDKRYGKWSLSPKRPKQILQIHDSILVESPKELAEEVASMLQQAMETIAPDIGVKLNADISIGDNWGMV